MSQSISLHPNRYDGRVMTMYSNNENAPHFNPKNANSVSIFFDSEPDGPALSRTEINVFHLDAATAEALGTLAAMTPETRAKILPALRHAMDEQRAEAEVDAED